MSGARPSESDVQSAFCAVLCDEWARAGVTDAVLSPGSRSTPMVAALDAEPRIRVHVVLDERAAGFVALGLGRATGTPAVVVTTSGTASVELHPAVVEAAQAGVPLIAVTTDRPPELHHVGAPQTVEQANLFAGVTRWAADPGVPDLARQAAWRSFASRAVAAAIGVAGPGPGPVHLNLPFREPLLGSAEQVQVPPGRPGEQPWHRADRPPPAPVPREISELLAAHAGGRGLIVAGEGTGRREDVLGLAAALGWPVLADPRSGCRVPDPMVVAAADALLRDAVVAAWTPEVVLRLGAPWASKVVNQWLAGLPQGVPQVLVDPWGRFADPDRRASHVAATTAAGLAREVAGGARPQGWPGQWQAAEKVAQSVMEEMLKKGGPLDLSEPAVARAALAAVPDGGTLVASSSMPVRDVEWYGAPRTGAAVVSNRGANGIDGVLSTALGVAAAGARPTTLLIGDLAFLYDAGSLLWAGDRQVKLTVVVVDNDGGGIFSFLPHATSLPADRFERYWGTPHGMDLVALAGAYGLEAGRVGCRDELDVLLDRSDEPGVRIGVVPSDRAANVVAHDRINAAVADALTAARARRGGPAA